MVFASYFETLNVKPGSRWAKRITLGVGCSDPLTFTADMLDMWRTADQAAPSEAIVYLTPTFSQQGRADQLRAYRFLGLDQA